MEKKNIEQLAITILNLIGEKENISYFTHCVTRLRFNLKNNAIVDLDKINKVKGVLGSQWAGNQLQIIIGADVDAAYNAICRISGLKEEDKIDELLNEDKPKFSIKSIVPNILDALTGSMAPLIPLLIGGGMIKLICTLMQTFNWGIDTSTYSILNWVGDAFLYFMPIFLGATAAKKMKANIGIGMLLGGVLLYPQFISAVTEGTSLSIFGLPVYLQNYSSTIIPILLTVYVLSLIEKLLEKVIPTILKSMMIPLLSLLIILPLELSLLAPLGYYAGTYVSAGIVFLYEHLGFVGVGLLAAFKPWITLTGMHMALVPYYVTSYASTGFEGLFAPASFISNINQGFACLAVSIKTKDADIRSQAISSALAAIFTGVTEPAMFAITLKYKKPMYAAMIGGAVAGIIAGLCNVKSYFMAAMHSFGIVQFAGPDGNLIKFLVALIVGALITFILTLIFIKNKEEGEQV